jgi:hypothetical protein
VGVGLEDSQRKRDVFRRVLRRTGRGRSRSLSTTTKGAASFFFLAVRQQFERALGVDCLDKTSGPAGLANDKKDDTDEGGEDVDDEREGAGRDGGRKTRTKARTLKDTPSLAVRSITRNLPNQYKPAPQFTSLRPRPLRFPPIPSFHLIDILFSGISTARLSTEVTIVYTPDCTATNSRIPDRLAGKSSTSRIVSSTPSVFTGPKTRHALEFTIASFWFTTMALVVSVASTQWNRCTRCFQARSSGLCSTISPLPATAVHRSTVPRHASRLLPPGRTARGEERPVHDRSKRLSLPVFISASYQRLSIGTHLIIGVLLYETLNKHLFYDTRQLSNFSAGAKLRCCPIVRDTIPFGTCCYFSRGLAF